MTVAYKSKLFAGRGRRRSGGVIPPDNGVRGSCQRGGRHVIQRSPEEEGRGRGDADNARAGAHDHDGSGVGALRETAATIKTTSTNNTAEVAAAANHGRSKGGGYDEEDTLVLVAQAAATLIAVGTNGSACAGIVDGVARVGASGVVGT